MSAATQARLTTAAINWPVTVGDRNIHYLLPEYWRTSTPDDLKLLRALSRPEGLQSMLERSMDSFVDGSVDTIASDEIRTRFATAILREHKPDFTAVQLVALDGTEHSQGPYTAPAYRALEAIDRMIGDLTAAARANSSDAVVAIVSDHGFIATHTAVNLRVAFVDAGLITLEMSRDEGAKVSKWDAQLWSGAATAAVLLRDPSDRSVRMRVAELLNRLAADPANGIARVLRKEQIRGTGGFPEAAFLIEFAPGYYLGSPLTGELRVPASSKGTHGYLPERPEMHASLFIAGKGISAGRNLGIVDMREIAPTFAAVLGVQLPHARAKKLDVHATLEP